MNQHEEENKIVCAGIKEPDMIFEQIYNSGEDLYAVRFFSQNDIDIRDSLGQYKFMNRNKIVWNKFSKPIECDLKELYFDIRVFIEKFVYLPDPDLYDIASAYVIASYFQEAFDFATYLTFLGPIKSGKTKALTILEMLCYRGYKTSSVTPAAISRLIEYYKVTPLLDETDKIANEYKTDVIGILNEGQKKPSRYIRADRDGPGIEIKDVFRFKAFAGTEKFLRSISSRSITFSMRKPKGRMPKINDEARDMASTIRNKLLYHRLMWNVKDSFNDDFLSDDRISEVFEPLFRISPFDEITEVLKNCALNVEASESEEEKTSIEARVFRAILEAYSEDKIIGSKIAIMDIAEVLNSGIDEREQLKNEQVGRICQRLGFRRTRMSKGRAGIYWNQSLVKDLAERYLDQSDIELYLHKEPSLLSHPSPIEDTQSEDSEGSEGSEGSMG